MAIIPVLSKRVKEQPERRKRRKCCLLIGPVPALNGTRVVYREDSGKVNQLLTFNLPRVATCFVTTEELQGENVSTIITDVINSRCDKNEYGERFHTNDATRRTATRRQYKTRKTCRDTCRNSLK